YKPLIQYLSEKGAKQLLSTTEDYYLQENSRLMPEADEPLYFTIDEKHNTIELTDKGIDYLSRLETNPNFFVLPNMGAELARLEQDPTLTEEARHSSKEALQREYSTKAERIHTVSQLLKAYALFEKDVEYVVLNQQVKIV